jgi:DNA-binding transcriptional LysR family regulator
VTFVAAGLGLAVVPEPTAALVVPGVVYVPLTGTPGIELVAATRTGDDNPVLARALGMLHELADAQL